MANIGPLEIGIVLIIALVVFGPKRLPELGNSLGKGIREFKRSLNEVQRQVTEEADSDRPLDRLPVGEPAARARAEEEPAREPKRLI